MRRILSPLCWLLLLAALTVHCTSVSHVRPKGIAGRAALCEEMEPHIHEIAVQKNLAPALIMGIIRVESHFNPVAESSAGARGLMQVMPSTGKGHQCGNLYDAHENIRCGASVLKAFLKRYKGHLVYGLSAYNAGYRLSGKAWKKKGLPKNQRYVDKVLRAKSRYSRGGCALLVTSF